MGDYGLDIDFSGLEDALNVQSLAERMRPEVEQAMQHARGQIVRLLPDGAHGTLRRAPQAIAAVTEEGVKGEVFIQEDNPASGYARFVEFGRAPGKYPPWSKETDPLFQWAQRKITSAAYKSTGKVQRKSAQRQTMIRTASFLIARKIARFGTKGQFPFERGWTAAQPRVETIVEYGLQKALTGR